MPLKSLEEQFCLAAVVENIPAMKHFVRMGVDVNKSFVHGLTVLHTAVEGNKIHSLNYLCSLDQVNINARTHHLMTPLSLAVKDNRMPLVKALLDAGADPNIPIAFDQTVVHLATFCRNENILQQLIQNGAQVDVADCFDQTPLAMSILTMPDKRICQILVEAGADANFKSRTKLPLLTEAILTLNIFHHFNVIQTLIDYGANINERDEVKLETSLHKAAMVGHVPLIEYLLQHGAEINAINVYGQTPYMIAKAQNNTRAAEVLSDVEDQRIEKKNLVDEFRNAAQQLASISQQTSAPRP